MLVANETVAQHLDRQEVPALFRIHEPPDPLKVTEFEEFITSLGFGLGAPPDRVTPRHFQRLLHRLHDAPELRPVAFLMLRTKRGTTRRTSATSVSRQRVTRTSPPRSGVTRTSSCTGRSANRAMEDPIRNSGRRGWRICLRWLVTRRRWSAGPRTPSGRSSNGRRSGSWPTRSATNSPAT